MTPFFAVANWFPGCSNNFFTVRAPYDSGRSLELRMSESVSVESVLSEIVGRLMHDLDDVIALIQRPLTLAAEAAEQDEDDIGANALPAFA